MNYCIISIDNSREAKKAAIRESLSYQEHFPAFVDARKAGEIEKWLRNPVIGWEPKIGELGIWLSQINVWRYIVDNDLDWMIAFEDDAILAPDGQELITKSMSCLPDDWDAFSLFTPDDQRDDYRYDVSYDENGYPRLRSSMFLPNERSLFYVGNDVVCRAAHGYSGVAVMYSQKGARRLLGAVEKRGLYSTSDCFLYIEAHTGRLEMYASHPLAKRIVTYDWANSPTLIHNTEKYNAIF